MEPLDYGSDQSGLANRTMFSQAHNFEIHRSNFSNIRGDQYNTYNNITSKYLDKLLILKTKLIRNLKMHQHPKRG
jgi:hypothetical protein